MLKGFLNGPPLTGRLKLCADGIENTVDAIFMLSWKQADNPAHVFIAYSPPPYLSREVLLR